MPRKMHPNSLENLKKGRQFKREDGSAAEANSKSQISRDARVSFQDVMRKRNTQDKLEEKAEQLEENACKSPAWFQLWLRVSGEMPPEQLEISKPKEEIAEEIEAALIERRRDRNESRTT